MPNKYTAHLSLAPSNYQIDFIGEMRMMLLYSPRMKEENLDPNIIPKQIMQEFERVIKERQPTRFEIRPHGKDSFQTAFSYTSPYNYPEASGLFQLKKEGNTLTLTSRSISPEERELLQKHHIASKGTLTVKAYGEVIESNAHIPASTFKPFHTWNLKDLSGGVRMVIRFPK